MARRVYQFASAVLAFAVILIMAVGGYAIYLHLSTAQYRIPLRELQAAVRQLPQIAASTSPAAQASSAQAAPVELKQTAEAPKQAAPLEKNPQAEKIETPAVPEQAVAVSAVAFPADTGASMAANLGLVSDLTVSEARSFRERGISAYRNGDLNGAIADFDQAIQLDPKFSAAYIDRGIVFYRLRKFDRAFADISRAKRLERANRTPLPGTSSSVVAKKPRPQQGGIALGMMPMFQRRPVGLD
jgi:tetratricopeptide (TPR) repeat protein